MSFSLPEAEGPLRRERLRTARLYFVCDARPPGDLEALLRAALGGGADIVQLREKELGRDEIERAAATFRRVADTHSALFVLNDDPELARICDADGVHVGQDDMPVAEARAIVGADRIVGLSTHSIAQADAGAVSGADYIAVGPVHATPTKEGRPAIGLDPVRHAAAHVHGLPWFAIGGMEPGTIGAAAAAGATRAVVVRAIAHASDPEAVTRALRAALTGGAVEAGRGAA